MEPGTRLGDFEIQGLLGEGGMGRVYRARDTRLNRAVALKVLPDAFTRDADRLARFKREAQVLASLNHPNIGAIYGLEQSQQMQALVLELVDGPTLAEIIEGSGRHALSLDEALAIARQVADALEAAHEQGIVHRDLKPANVKVRDDGRVKVLDFGLAKALDQESGVRSQEAARSAEAPGALSISPTITSPAMTAAGIILGTAAYMAPEQAKGKPADKRSDIWAFGAVLYEMLTGRRAFHGEGISDTLAEVLRGEPDWTALPPNVPEHIKLLLRRCLERDRTKRVSDIGVARFLLTESIPPTAPPPPTAIPSAASRSVWRRALPALAAAVGAAAITAAGFWFARPSQPAVVVTRFGYSLKEGQRFTNSGRHVLAIAPDGTRVAFVVNTQLFVKSMSESDATPIRGTDFTGTGGLTSPVFSPDGQSIAFFAGGEIKKVSINGGPAVPVARDIQNPFGLSWNDDSLAIGAGPEGILRVPATGGTPTVLIAATNGEFLHGPQMLPDGRSVLFTAASADRLWDAAKIVVQTIGSTERKTLVEGATDARYLPSGHLVYAVRGVLFAQRFDARKLELLGTPQPIVEGVARSAASQTGAAQFAVSNTGTLLFVSGPASGGDSDTDLAISDTNGIVRPLKLPGTHEAPRFSPNGRLLAAGLRTAKDSNVWIYDVSGTSAPRQLTVGGSNRFPVWTHDGSRIAFQSSREGDEAIFWQPVDGSAAAQRLTKPAQGESHTPDGFFPKDDRLLLTVAKERTKSLWTLLVSDRKIESYIPNQFAEYPQATVSPDGRWIAYATSAPSQGALTSLRQPVGEAATGTVFVQPFPVTGAIYRVMAGVNPFWAPRGDALYAAAPSRITFSMVSISTQAGFSMIGQPKQIPRTTPSGGGPNVPRQYDISPDGEHFVMVVSSNVSNLTAQPQVNVVLNWFDELKAKVP